MPTYTYKCLNEDCEKHDQPFEVEQSMKDDKLVCCEVCEQDTLQKIIVPGGGFRIGGMGVHKPTAHWGG